MKFKGLYSFVTTASMLFSLLPAGNVSAEVLSVEEALKTAPVIENGKIVMPQADGGYELSLFGSDNRQVIDLDGTVYTPLVDTEVKLIYQAELGDERVEGESNVSVTVPGLYTASEGDNECPDVIPSIQEWKGNQGEFTLSDSSEIVYSDESLKDTAEKIKRYFEGVLGVSPALSQGEGESGDIVLSLSEKSELGKEGYEMVIGDTVEISAPQEIGVLYGGTTITQILYSDNLTAPKGLVRDYPAYEVRSVMMDLGRPYYPLEFIEDVGLYMAYYKLNELHAHLNEGSFRVQTESYGDLLNATKSYPKGDYIKMEDTLLEYGVSVLNEIDTPGHSASFTKTDIPMLDQSHLDVTTPEARQKVEEGITKLYDEFIDGTVNGEMSQYGPIVKNNEIHLGFDEYVQNPDYWNSYKQYTIDMLNYVTEKGTNAREWIFLGNDPSVTERFPAFTPEELAQIKHPERITANIWIEMWGDAKLALDYGFNIVNSENVRLYFVPGVKGYFQNMPLASRFDNWEVTNYYAGATKILNGHPRNRGASACMWFDTAFSEHGYSYEDIFSMIKDMVMIISEKTWHGDKSEGQTGEGFEKRVEKLGNFSPLSNPGAYVASETKKVAEYSFEEGLTDSSNGYTAQLSGDAAVEDGALKLNKTGYMSLPFKKLGFPYTVSFDLTLTGDSAGGVLFSNTDGSEKMFIDENNKINYQTTGPCADNINSFIFDYALRQNERVSLTLCCEDADNITMDNAKIPTKRELKLVVNDTDVYSAVGESTTGYSTRMALPVEKIGEGIEGKIDNLLIYNVNALAESLTEGDELSSYAVNMMGEAYEMEDVSKFSANGLTGISGGVIDNTTFSSGSGALKVTNKARYDKIIGVHKEVKENTKYVMSFRFKSSDEKLSSLWLFVQKYFNAPDGSTQLIVNQNTVDYITPSTDWQYVSIPVTVGKFHEQWEGDTANLEFWLTPCHMNNNTEAATAVSEIWIDCLSFREVPQSAELSCEESTASVDDGGNLVITNVYNNKYMSTEGMKLIIDGTASDDFTVTKTESLTRDTTVAVIKYTGALSTGMHNIDVVMHDVWDNEVKNTVSVDFVNYAFNHTQGIYECESVFTGANQWIASSNVAIDNETYYSGTGSIKATGKSNYSDIAQISLGNVQLDKKYVVTLMVKPDKNAGVTRNNNNASGLQTYLRYYVNGVMYQTALPGVYYGKDGDDWRKVSFIIDNAERRKIATQPGNASSYLPSDATAAQLSVLLTPFGAFGGCTQDMWIDCISAYMLPEDGVMVPVCESTSYEQKGTNAVVTFTFNSANVAEANEYIKVNGIRTDADVTREIKDGKTVITAKLDSLAMGAYSVALSSLEDIWGRKLDDVTADVFVLEHSKNILSALYDCDNLSAFNTPGMPGTKAELTTEEAYRGTTSLKVTAKGINELNKPYEYEIKNNTPQIYSLMLKGDGTADRMYIFRDYYNEKGEFAMQFPTAINIQPTTEWQKVTFTFTDNVPSTKGNVKKGRIYLSQLGSTPERTFYIDCIELRTLPSDGEMLSSLETVTYRAGGIEFVFDTEYVTADKLFVDATETPAKITRKVSDGKTCITASPYTALREGEYTVSLAAEDLWKRSVSAEGNVAADESKCYAEDVSAKYEGTTVKISAKLCTNIPANEAVSVAVAVYDSGSLKAVKILDETLKSNMPVTIDESVEAGTIEKPTASIMVWNSTKGMIPYINTVICE